MEFKLRSFREEKGYTQSDLAKLVGKSLRTVRMWETGESYPNIDMLFRLCGVFDTDPNTMLGWYDDHPEDLPRGPAREKLPPEEDELMRNYRACSNQWKRTISMTARAAAGETREEAESAARLDSEVSA